MKECVTVECEGCKRQFPGHLCAPMMSHLGQQYLCAICALKARNDIHGLPADTPFHGPTRDRVRWN